VNGADSGAHLRLVTNGQVSRDEIWDRLMSVHSSVLISCDAADPELFAALRRGGTIQRLAATATRITHYRDLYSAPADLVSLLTIVSRSNLHDLPNIPSLAANLGIPKVSLFPIQVPLDDGRHLASDVDGTRRALDATIGRARAIGIELHMGAAMDIQLALKADVKSLCMHPWAFAYVSHDGGVGFCDQLIGNRKYILGRLGPDGFLSVWNNENFERLRRSHVNKSITDEFAACRWCYKQRYLEYEHWVYPELQAHYISTLTRDTLYEYDENAAGERLSFLC
jgi:radical SAM protein with 4Fe4S-binding SPASM domain